MNQGDKNIASKSTVMISPAASPIIGKENLILNLKSEQIANNVLNLYAGQEDQERYKYFTSDKFRAKLAEHKDIDINKIKIKANRKITSVRMISFFKIISPKIRTV